MNSVPKTECSTKLLLEIATFIVNGNAFIDSVDNSGFTPLCLAASKGNTAMLKFLVSRGANINHRIDNGVTPMYLAASNMKKETCLAMVELCAELSFTDLMYGLRSNEVMSLLMEVGANFDRARDWAGRSLLHWAAWEGKSEVITWLLKQKSIDINSMDFDKWTPLHYAAQNGNTNVVKLLMDRGGDNNLEDKWGATPFHVAITYGHESLFSV